MATPTVTSIPSATSSQAAPSCTTAVPGKHGKVPLGSCNSYYSFDPSFEGNLAFAVLFGVSLIVHLVQAITFKKRFCWVIIVGAAWEAAGFILRTLGTRDQQQMGYSIAGQLLFLLAPLWINAFAYMLAARLVYYVLPDQKVFRIKARVLTKIFVAIDIVCFLVQAAGGLMMSNTEVAADDPIVRNGQRVYMIGCGLQLGFVVIFCILMGRFYFKMIRAQRFDLNMKRVKALVWVMYAVLLLIVTRIIFRLVEFGPGASYDNPILTNENYAFGLDALPMVLALVLLNAVHPGIVLRGDNSDFPRLSRKEKKQLKREKKEAKKAAKEEKKQRKAGKTMQGSEVFILEERSMVESPYDTDERTGARRERV